MLVGAASCCLGFLGWHSQHSPRKSLGRAAVPQGYGAGRAQALISACFSGLCCFISCQPSGCDVGHTAPSSTASRGACRALSLSDTKSYRRLCRFVYVNILCTLIMAFSIFGRGYIDYTFLNVLCIYAFHSLIGRPGFLCI